MTHDTHDTHDTARVRLLFADTTMPPMPTHDLVGPALREGRRRVRHRRLAGVAVATGLSCAAAVAVPPLLELVRPGPSGVAAGSLWAPDSTREGAVLSRIDDALVVEPGPQSSVEKPAVDGDPWSISLRDWRISWRHDPAAASPDRWLVASLNGNDLVVRSGGQGRAERTLGTVPLADRVTVVAVRAADGDGWICLIVGKSTGPNGFTPQVRLHDVGVPVDVDDSIVIDGIKGGSFAASSTGDLMSSLSAMRLRGDSPDNPFLSADAWVTTDEYSQGSAPPGDGSVTSIRRIRPVIITE